MKKVGVVGTGFMGITHAEAWLHTDASISACVSKDKDSVQRFSKKYGAEIFPDLERMLPWNNCGMIWAAETGAWMQ